MSNLSCREGSELIGARRAGLSASQQLRLEAHIADCERCRGDADHLDMVVGLMDGLPERVTSDARRTALLGRALDGATKVRRRERLQIRGVVRAGLAAAAAALLITGGYRILGGGPDELGGESGASGRVLSGIAQLGGRSLSEGSPVAPGDELLTSAGARLQLGRAQVTTGAHTRLRWDADLDSVALLAGQLTAQVTHDPSRPFRVQAPTFTVEVTGTRFTVDETSVTVSEGSVRVIDRAGQVVAAALQAGDRYVLEQYEELRPTERPDGSAEAPIPSKPAPAVEAEPERGEPRATTPAQKRTDRPVPRTPTRAEPAPKAPSATALLKQARASLAKRDIDGARARIAQALAGAPSRLLRAEAETLLADCARSSGQLAEAARRYTQVAERYRDLKAGENALYAAARAHARLGHDGRAAALLQRYQQRYPKGLFRREVQKQLRGLQAPR